MPTVYLGIDILEKSHYRALRGARVGLLTNIASCSSDLQPTIDLIARNRHIDLKAVFAPEHGLYGALQDQVPMRSYYDTRRKIPIISLYGKKLTAPQRILSTLDMIVIDIQDIGARYYTFLWSAILMIYAMARLRKKVIILDRPNPLNGVDIEGPVLEPAFSSFVGLFPVPVRHGMTIAELCHLVNGEMGLHVDLEVVTMKGWRRNQFFPDTRLEWTIPSPNMPSFSTALVYPGMCLLEGTNISEGRGTTHPFEIFGAPWLEPYELVRVLKRCRLRGVVFRPLRFVPTFNKYKDQLCGGVSIHVTNRAAFRPFATGLHIVKSLIRLFPRQFKWGTPPYEFEQRLMPFDILAGNGWIRPSLDQGTSIAKLTRRWQQSLGRFKRLRKRYLLYN